MNFEGLENWRAEVTEQVARELLTIVKDKKVDIKDRISAAKVVDAMSDSIIKASLMSEVAGQQADNNKRMISKLDRLTEKE